LKTIPSITGVIVADDDPVIRGILRSKLAAINQEVFLAYDGEEAVDLAARMQAAMVILDINMPRLDGLRACQFIRKLPGYAQTPIVILTSDDGQGTAATAASIGATAFLTKPFRSALLLEVLSRFLPMDATTLRAIRSEADRATRVVQARSPAAPDRASITPEPENALDRGKNMLAVLRGW